MKHLFFLFGIMMSLILNAQTNTIKSDKVEKKIVEAYTYNIISSSNKTWGYDIYIEKRLLIHQPNVPGLPGNEGFKIKAYAKKVAKLVIEKLRNGEMLPTVTIEELEKLKVL